MEPKTIEAKTSVVDLKLNVTANSNQAQAQEKPPILVTQKRYGVYWLAEILSDSSFVEPDGFSSIEFRNIGSAGATIANSIPLNPTDAPLILKTDLFVKVTQKIKVTFTGTNADKQILIIKTYLDEL